MESLLKQLRELMMEEVPESSWLSAAAQGSLSQWTEVAREMEDEAVFQKEEAFC